MASIYELTSADQAALWEFVTKVRTLLMARHGVEAFNIGVNDDLTAGQTVLHANIHVIPRRPGDMTDRRGGVRWIIADKAKHWDEPRG